MSVVVSYPAEVKEYSVSAGRDRAVIVLRGVELSGPDSGKLRVIGSIEFGDPNPVSDKDFITRGGFLRMDRSLEMLSGILDILRNERPLYLSEDGTLSSAKGSTADAEA